MKLVQFDFKYAGPFGQEMTDAMDGLARSIADEPGLLWKIWTENRADGEAGGIYLFTDEQSARDYMVMHTERLKSFGIDKVNAKLFDVNTPLTQITNGPL
ncbi:monooxygenase [Sedimenticola thiotaurini]|uniref:Monooxygenase n=1 Tax=Sedimenticola thiotaurini TaxID=1543721 RepID=A0A0F7K3Z9_9GAMM|nr:monooxygenase [Sedimenticola thiotaurini]AKH21658.1 monooxygenase [Sedimenticola thiotaurini]